MGMLRASALKKGLHLSCHTDPAVPEMLRGNVVRLRQVLTNLVSNAIKFTPQGRVSVDIRRKIAANGSERVRFEVQRYGHRNPVEGAHELFVPFSQADESTTRVYGGTGLGLAISKQLVTLMGGEIGVTSDAGAGSTFRFEIPLVPSLDPVAEAASKR